MGKEQIADTNFDKITKEKAKELIDRIWEELPPTHKDLRVRAEVREERRKLLKLVLDMVPLGIRDYLRTPDKGTGLTPMQEAQAKAGGRLGKGTRRGIRRRRANYRKNLPINNI